MNKDLIQENGDYVNFMVRKIKEGERPHVTFMEDGDSFGTQTGQYGDYTIVQVKYEGVECSMILDAKMRSAAYGSNLLQEVGHFKEGEIVEISMHTKKTKHPNPLKLYSMTRAVNPDKPEEAVSVDDIPDTSDIDEKQAEKVKVALEKHRDKPTFNFENVKNTIMTNLKCDEKQANALFVKWFAMPQDDEIKVDL